MNTNKETNDWEIKPRSLSEQDIAEIAAEVEAKRRRKWPWSKMEVGQEVVFDSTKIAFKDVEHAAYLHGNAYGKRFICKHNYPVITVMRIK